MKESTLRHSFNMKTLGAGSVSAIFGCTGPALIIIGAATSNGLSYAETINWIFAVYFFSGLLGIFLSLKYRQPIAGAHSIAGAVLVAGSLSIFTLNEAIGAYVVAHVLIILLGMSGLIGKVMNWLPVPIVMGMVVGVMIRFAIEMITAITISPLLAGSAIVAFLIATRLRIPPVLAALTISIGLALWTNQFTFQHVAEGFVMPQLMMPVFSIEAIISISIPLALLIICTENAQGAGVLRAKGYEPPSNALAIYGSVFGLVGSFFGAHAINVAGPMTAICSEDEVGKKESRFAASVVCGGFFAVFGLFSAVLVPFIIAVPGVIVSVIAGLAMLGVLMNSLKAAFSDSQFQMGAFFAFIIGMSGISFQNIGAPLWAIIGSLLVSYLVEKEHFVLERKGETV